jgi:hypothetical protein
MIGRDQEWLEWWASEHLPGAQDRAQFLGQSVGTALAEPAWGGSATGPGFSSHRRVDKSHPRRMLVVGTRAD